MPDPKTIERLRGLVLSALDLKTMTNWPDALIEDYLNIVDNLILLSDLLDIEIDTKIEEISTDFTGGSIPFAEANLLIEDNANLFWDSVEKVLNAKGLIVSDTSVSRLLSTNGDKLLTSVANLAVWILGTANQILITNSGNGKVIISIPDTDITGAELETLTDGSNADVLHSHEYVSAAANLGDHKLIRGDGGAKGVQESTIVVSDAGEMTNPSQPCFSVMATEQSNFAVDQAVTVVFETEVFDVGNNFSSNIFTAPVTGKCGLHLNLVLLGIDVDASYYDIAFVTSNRSYHAYLSLTFSGDPILYTWNMSVIADMDINDTVYVTIEQTGGAQQTDIDPSTRFTGILHS